MLKELTSSHNMIGSLILLVACCMFAFAASGVGISDNPPGIALAYLSAIALVLAFVHPWRTSKQFRYLIYASGIGLVLFGVLHNVFEGIASNLGETNLVYGLLNGAGGAFFLIAILVCPSALLVGVVGMAVMSLRGRRLQHGPPIA
jgi:multidrug transporter EmrE-like cation transporter